MPIFLKPLMWSSVGHINHYIYIYIYIYNWCSCSEALVAIFWHSYVVVCYICQYFERFIPHYACHYTSHSFANGHLQGIFTSLHFKLKVSSSFHLGFEGDLSVLCKSHLSHVDILYWLNLRNTKDAFGSV